MRIFSMGDVHGAYKALMQCLKRSEFDYENDKLVQLGDICDGWPEVYECVEELLKIKNLVAIHGNHDDWFTDFLQYGQHGSGWTQGGWGTLKSYIFKANPDIELHKEFIKSGYSFKENCPLTLKDIPDSHINFFLDQKYFHVDDNRLFVHGGFNRRMLLKDQLTPELIYNLFWDRELWNHALSYEAWIRGTLDADKTIPNEDNFREIFIGHTTTEQWRTNKPMKAGNVWNLDTGAGWGGKLTIMDINTKEYWQSDLVTTLYPDERGRGQFIRK